MNRRDNDKDDREHRRSRSHNSSSNRRDDQPSRRDGDRPRRNGERKRFDGERPRGDGERKRFDGERPRRDGDRNRYEADRPKRDSRRDSSGSFGRGGTRGGGRSDRGGTAREFTEAERLQHELRPVRSEHDDPQLPDEVTEKDLHPSARNELKTLQPETAERVARHLAMVAAVIESDPELAHQHAISASRRAGRIPVAREMLAITAYHIGDYALALRELRTYRRLSGSQGHIALMVECERALGRPQKAIETGIEADPSRLNVEQKVQLAIAMSGARLDLGQTQQALFELDIPELHTNTAFDWTPELFAAYANVLEDLGRSDESATWRKKALIAEQAINEILTGDEQIEVFEIVEETQTDPTEID